MQLVLASDIVDNVQWGALGSLNRSSFPWLNRVLDVMSQVAVARQRGEAVARLARIGSDCGFAYGRQDDAVLVLVRLLQELPKMGNKSCVFVGRQGPGATGATTEAEQPLYMFTPPNDPQTWLQSLVIRTLFEHLLSDGKRANERDVMCMYPVPASIFVSLEYNTAATPIDLQTDLTLGTDIYTLCGAVLYTGDQAQGRFGHYTALVRSPRTLNWYLCDDSRVQGPFDATNTPFVASIMARQRVRIVLYRRLYDSSAAE